MVRVRVLPKSTPEDRQRTLRRLLTSNPKVKVGLTEGQKQALAQPRTQRPD